MCVTQCVDREALWTCDFTYVTVRSLRTLATTAPHCRMPQYVCVVWFASANALALQSIWQGKDMFRIDRKKLCELLFFAVMLRYRQDYPLIAGKCSVYQLACHSFSIEWPRSTTDARHQWMVQAPTNTSAIPCRLCRLRSSATSFPRSWMATMCSSNLHRAPERYCCVIV